MGHRLTQAEAEALKQKVHDRLNMANLPVQVAYGPPAWDQAGQEAVYVQVGTFIHPFDGDDTAPYVEVLFQPGKNDRTMQIMSFLANLLQAEFRIAMFFTERSHAVYGEKD